MTESLSSQPAYWASLDRCLHSHHTVIAGDLRLQAAHAAFQLQLATFRALHPDASRTLIPSEPESLRVYLEFLLDEISRNLLVTPAETPLESPSMPPPSGRDKQLDSNGLLELAENTVRYLRDNPSLWTRVGLAALQVRALADLQNAYALATGALVPSGDPEDRTKLTGAEIARLISQELDPLVRAHEAGAPEFVADYRLTRHPRNPGEEKPASRPFSSRFSFGLRKRPELSLPN